VFVSVATAGRLGVYRGGRADAAAAEEQPVPSAVPAGVQDLCELAVRLLVRLRRGVHKGTSCNVRGSVC
jgi:hypothetical protein